MLATYHLKLAMCWLLIISNWPRAGYLSSQIGHVLLLIISNLPTYHFKLGPWVG